MANAQVKNAVARDVVEFVPGELRFAGCDYGVAFIEATSQDAQIALGKIASAAQRGGCRVDVDLRITVHDGQAIHVEEKHAGREGTAGAGG